jgi:hypothetical protein
LSEDYLQMLKEMATTIDFLAINWRKRSILTEVYDLNISKYTDIPGKNKQWNTQMEHA